MRRAATARFTSGTAAPQIGRAAASKTYVLVRGAWHGGWCWSKVALILRGRGHTVLTPTQTGLGERSHLLSVILENGQSVFTPLPVLREAWKWGARPDFRQQGCRTRPSRRAK